MQKESNLIKEQEQQKYHHFSQFFKDSHIDGQFQTGLLHPKKIQYLQENNSHYFALFKREEDESIINQSEILFKSEQNQSQINLKLKDIKFQQIHNIPSENSQKLSNFFAFDNQIQQQSSEDTILQQISPQSPRIAKENLISMCGLKELSSIVYGFMPVSGKFKCITIANQLNEILSLSQKNSKVAGSCKRRICDILNILLGVGLLKKDGKKFQMLHSNEDNQNNVQSKQQKKLQYKIKNQIEDILAFRKIIKARQSLLNKKLALLEGIQQLRKSKSSENKSEQIIRLNFPFILVSADQMYSTSLVKNNIVVQTLGKHVILADCNVLEMILTKQRDNKSTKKDKMQKYMM